MGGGNRSTVRSTISIARTTPAQNPLGFARITFLIAINNLPVLFSFSLAWFFSLFSPLNLACRTTIINSAHAFDPLLSAISDFSYLLGTARRIFEGHDFFEQLSAFFLSADPDVGLTQNAGQLRILRTNLEPRFKTCHTATIVATEEPRGPKVT